MYSLLMSIVMRSCENEKKSEIVKKGKNIVRIVDVVSDGSDDGSNDTVRVLRD